MKNWQEMINPMMYLYVIMHTENIKSYGYFLDAIFYSEKHAVGYLENMNYDGNKRFYILEKRHFEENWSEIIFKGYLKDLNRAKIHAGN